MKRRYTLVLVLAVMVLAGFFRFWQLDKIPPGLYPDVAVNGTDALTALKNHDFKVFYPANNGREGLFIDLDALVIWLLGPSILALKIMASILGLLTVLAVYGLGREMFDYLGSRRAQLIGLLASFFTAISFWHVNFSRLGFRAIMVPFCLAFSFWFLFRGINNKKFPALNFILAGLFFGLGFNTYIAFRIAPVILLPPVAFEVARHWHRIKRFWNKSQSAWQFFKGTYFKDGWWRWDAFFVFMVLAALPLAVYYWQHPADFMGRAGQVSIFASDNPVKILAESTIKTLGQFVFQGDFNWRHNLSGSPQIFWPLIPFFLAGLIFCLVQAFKPENWKHKNYPALTAAWTLLFWWSSMLMPSIMTNEGLPHALRSIGAIPPSYIFAALGVFILTRLFQTKIYNKIILFALYVLLSLGGLFLIGAEYWRYFVVWGQNQETRGAFTQIYVDQADYLNSLPADVHKYVIVNEGGVAVPYPDGIPMPAQTAIYLTDGKNVEFIKPDQLSSLKISRPAVILPLKSEVSDFLKIKQKFPGGTVEIEKGFSVYSLK